MASSEPRKEQKLSQDPLECFPEAVLYRILKSADVTGNSGKNYAMVSRSWNKFFSQPGELWESLSLTIPTATANWFQALLWLEKRLQSVKRLKLSSKAYTQPSALPSMWTAFLTMLPKSNLRALQVDLPGINFHPDIAFFVGRMMQLEALDFQNLPGSGSLRCFTSLTRLRELVLYLQYEHHQALPAGLSCLTALEKLGLHNRTSYAVMYEPEDVRFSDCFANLKELALANLEISPLMLNGLTSLTYLELQQMEWTDPVACHFPASLRRVWIGDNWHESTLKECIGLRQLQLMDCDEPQITEAILEEAIENMTQLEYLDLSAALIMRVPPAVAALKSLKVLCRTDLHSEDAFMFSFPKGPYLASLQALGLGPLETIPDSLAGAPNIRTLDASKISLFDTASAKVVSSMPQLHELYLPAEKWPHEALRGLLLLGQEAPHVRVIFGGPDCTQTSLSEFSLPPLGLSPCYRA